VGTAALTTDLVLLANQNAAGAVREQSASNQSEGTLFVFGTASNGFSDDGVGLNGGVSAAFTAQSVASTIIFQWMMNLTPPDTVLNGGMRIRVEQAANFGEWFVAGDAEYDGGFKIFAVDTTRTLDRTSATSPTLTAIDRLGFIVDLVVSGIDGSCALVDVSRRGTGMTVTGGTVADPITPIDIEAADNTTSSQLGMWRRNSSTGSFSMVGRTTIGNTAGTLLTVFRATNVVTTISDMPVKAEQNQLTIESNATNKTDFVIGTEIGTGVESVGVGGGSFTGTSSDPARTLTINSIDADTLNCHFFGVSLVIGAKINLTGAFNKFVSCLVSAYDSIVLRTSATLRASTITDSVATPSTATSADGGAVDLGASDPAVDIFKDNTIQNSPRGIMFNPSATGNLTLDNITFTNNAVCDAAIQFDTPSTFLDQTADANSAAINDVQFFPTVSVTNDAFLLGLKQPGPRVRITVGTIGVGTYTVTWQYRSSPSVWTNLSGVTDGTGAFKTVGENDVTFTVPTNWVATTEGTIGPFFYIRALRNAGTMTTNPLGDSCLTGFDIRLVSGTGIATTIKVQGGTAPIVEHVTAGTFTVENNVTVIAQGVTEGTPISILAAETVGSRTIGDVLLNAFADDTGKVTLSLNYEAAFDPSGLDVRVVARNQGVAIAAIADDGGVFTDETLEASNNVTADMTLLPAVPAVNDAYQFGHDEEFSRLKLNVTTALVGTGNTIVWEYWNGSAWTALASVVDGTNGLETLGENIVSWTVPGDWVTRTDNGQGPFKYVRFRLSATTTVTTVPVGGRVTLDTTRFLPYDEIRTVLTTGLTDNVNWVFDTISKF